MADIYATIIAQLKTDLLAAGVVAAEVRVYKGRRPQGVTNTDREVWVERLPVEDESATGAQDEERHPYLLHVFVADPGNSGPAKTGAAQVTSLQGHMRTIVARYQGARPFFAALPGMITAEAVEETVDTDSEEEKKSEGTVRVTFVVSS